MAGFSGPADETGAFKIIREDHGATPNIVLPPGSYVVHVASDWLARCGR